MYCGVTEGKPLTIEEYSELYPAMTIYIDYVLQASISQNTAVLEGYEWYVDGNTIEYVIYYQPAFEPYIDELRNGMLSLDWKTVLEMEYTAFENLYSVRPERIILTYAIGDVIIYSSYESGY